MAWCCTPDTGCLQATKGPPAPNRTKAAPFTSLDLVCSDGIPAGGGTRGPADVVRHDRQRQTRPDRGAPRPHTEIEPADVHELRIGVVEVARERRARARARHRAE